MKKKIGVYIFDSQIGSGQYGEVYKAYKEGTNEIFAVKSIPKSNIPSKVKTYLDREVNILQLINHPNVIHLIDLKMSDNNYYIVMEFCNGQDLGAYKKKYKTLHEKTVRNFAKQLVSGIAAIHKAQAIHRDIKLANIMLHYEKEDDKVNENPIVKIGDFGFARLIEISKEDNDTRLELSHEMSFVGTPLNMAPELLHKNKYSSKADFWSLGTCIYELLIGRVPFRGVDKADLTNNVDKGLIPFPKTIKLSMECLDFILKCLKFDKKMRINLDELTKHEFITTDKYTDFDYKIFKMLNPQLAKIPESSHPEFNYFLNNIDYTFVPQKLKIINQPSQEKNSDLNINNVFGDSKVKVNEDIKEYKKDQKEAKNNKNKASDSEDSSDFESEEEEVKIKALAKDYKVKNVKSHFEKKYEELKIEEDYVKLKNEPSPGVEAQLIDKIVINDDHFSEQKTGNKT